MQHFKKEWYRIILLYTFYVAKSNQINCTYEDTFIEKWKCLFVVMVKEKIGGEYMEFNYYYGTEADQFSFIRIPKALLLDKNFATLSLQAKMLYGILLDRMGLSMRNGWCDKENRVYIIYQISEIQEDMGFSKKKAIEYLKELEEFGLVEKKRRGLGLPSILYVKSFLVQEENSRGVENDTSRGTENGTLRGAETKLQEVTEEEPHINKTKMNDTYDNNIESNHILSSDVMEGEMDYYAPMIKDNIEYEYLLERYPLKKELLEGIFDLIVETVLCQSETLLIASNQYPIEHVKNKFLKLNYSHVAYVVDCLQENGSKVKNIKKYLLAALFNAPSTIEGYYQAEVNNDMARRNKVW